MSENVRTEHQTQYVDYNFGFYQDPRYLSHNLRTAIGILAGPSNTIPYVEDARKNLNIRHIQHSIQVVRRIPQPNEMWRIHSETGTASRSMGVDKIELFFDPCNPHMLERLSSWNDREIQHEMNHIARTARYPLHKTLIDGLVSEGLAIYDEENLNSVYANSHWGNVLGKGELDTELALAKYELQSEQYNFADWFYGKDGNHKRFAGYSLGNHLIRAFYKNNPGIRMSEAVLLPSLTILNHSGL